MGSGSLSLPIHEEYVSEGVDTSVVTNGIYIDIKKAFDSINDQKLSKIEEFGIRDFMKKWIVILGCSAKKCWNEREIG